jgi:hypothetical protein
VSHVSSGQHNNRVCLLPGGGNKSQKETKVGLVEQILPMNFV